MDEVSSTADQAMILQYRDYPGFDATAESNRRTLTDALDSLLAGNEEAFWAIFDPDVTFHEASCLPYGGAHKGLEAVKRADGELCACYSSMRSVMEAVLASRDLAIIYQTITVTAAATGREVTLPVAELFRFRNGKVVEWRANYFDACMVAEALTGRGGTA